MPHLYRLERLCNQGLQSRRERRARSRVEKILHRSRQDLLSADVARSSQSESRTVPLLFSVEPAGVDEAEQLDVGRCYAQAKLRAVRKILSQIPWELQS